MEYVGAFEARIHLTRLLERVARGEQVTITKHGVPMAILQSPDSKSKQTVAGTIAELKEFREGKRLRGLSVRKMIEEGRG